MALALFYLFENFISPMLSFTLDNSSSMPISPSECSMPGLRVEYLPSGLLVGFLPYYYFVLRGFYLLDTLD
jgi:hypothetical protein